MIFFLNDFFGDNAGEAVIAHTPANPTGERHTAHTNKRSAKWATRPPYVQVPRPVRARSARKFASCYYEIRNRAVPSVIRGSERRHRPPTGRVLCASYVGGDLIHGCPSARCTRRSRAAPTPAAATGAPADIAGGRAVVAMLRTTRPPAQRPRGELRTRSRAEPPPAARLPRSWDRRRASGCRRQRPGQRWGIGRCVHSCGTESLALPSRTVETPSGESVCAQRRCHNTSRARAPRWLTTQWIRASSRCVVEGWVGGARVCLWRVARVTRPQVPGERKVARQALPAF